jgi:hypothetical protein
VKHWLRQQINGAEEKVCMYTPTFLTKLLIRKSNAPNITGKLDIHRKKTHINLCLMLYTKVIKNGPTSKNKRQKYRTSKIKLLPDLGKGKTFLYRTQ